MTDAYCSSCDAVHAWPAPPPTKLTTIVATRGRPTSLIPTLSHTVKMLSRDDSTILLCVDDDDAETIAALPQLPADPRLKISIKPREDTRGAKYQRALSEAPADLYMVGHDATAIITKGFDQMFVNGAKLFPDKIGVACSHMANASFPALQCVSQKWVDLVGYIYNPAYPFWFIDHELDDLARMTGRVVYTDVQVESHPGYVAKTLRMHDLVFWIDYFDMSVYRRRAMARKIINAADEPEWRKEVLRSWVHPVEARSAYIHYHLRQNAAKTHEVRAEGGEPDDGYLRAFEAAREDLKRMDAEIQAIYAREAA
jgi:hypothetical protein